MHRQSLGSPISKLHGHGGSAIAVAKDEAINAEDTKRRDSFSSPSLIGEYDDEDSSKAAKLHRLSISPRSPPKSENLIHLIPVLILLCFLILYLCSHNPSQSDLDQFNGFKRLQNRAAADSSELISGLNLNELQKGDVLAIQSLRNLQEIDKRPSKSRYGRRLGDFWTA